MTLTGLVLRWPKRQNRRQRFSIKWRARWRRVNYDLHSVLGFYALWLGLMLAITGLVWGYNWFGEGLYHITGGDKSLSFNV